MISWLGRLLGWEAEIPAEEREALLAYLNDEWKIAAFQDLEAERYNSVVAKYGGPEAAAAGTPGLREMLPAARRLAQAAAELDRRHSELGPLPDAASAAYFEWQGTYMAYGEWASAIASAYEAFEAGIEPDLVRIQHLFNQMEKCRERAQNEERKLIKRLKLRGEDVRQLLQESRTAAKSEKWRPS